MMDDHDNSSRGAAKRPLKSSLKVVPNDAARVSRITDPRPKTIGRLIAQTALIADSARQRNDDASQRPRNRFGWFL